MKSPKKRRKHDEDYGSMSDSCLCNSRSKDIWTLINGFPPGTTVDELKYFCKKKATEYPKDNLHIPEGTFKDKISEYTRCFKNFFIESESADNINKENKPLFESRLRRKSTEGFIRFEGPLYLDSEYKVSFIDYFKPATEIKMSNGNQIMNSQKKSEFQNQLENHRHTSRWRFLEKNTNLQLEGERFLQTEKAEKYVLFPLEPRSIAIKPTANLKLEGEMEKKTETGDKFHSYPYQSRPPLCKKDTNLHMEGDLQMVTEFREQYIPTSLQTRPKISKKGTFLKLDGNLELSPEYRSSYVEHKYQRPSMILPVNNLKTEGNFDQETQHQSRFSENQVIHPIIPNLRKFEEGKNFCLGNDGMEQNPEYRAKYINHQNPERRKLSRPTVNLKSEGDFEYETENKTQFTEKELSKREGKRTSDNIFFEGNLYFNSENKNAFVNRGNLPLPERSKAPMSKLGEEIKMDDEITTDPEYKSSYVNFPRRRPSVMKPKPQLQQEGKLLLQTEKNESYKPFENVEKVSPIRRKTELAMDGSIECQPEYRKAYQDYLIREKIERKPRPFDNVGTQNQQQVEKVHLLRKKDELVVPRKLEKEVRTQKSSSLERKALAPNVHALSQPDSDCKTVSQYKRFYKTMEVPNLAYQDPKRSPISSLIHTPVSVTPRSVSPTRSYINRSSPHRDIHRKNSLTKIVSPRLLTPNVFPNKDVQSRSPPQKYQTPKSASQKCFSPKKFISPKPPQVPSRCTSPTKDPASCRRCSSQTSSSAIFLPPKTWNGNVNDYYSEDRFIKNVCNLPTNGLRNGRAKSFVIIDDDKNQNMLTSWESSST